MLVWALKGQLTTNDDNWIRLPYLSTRCVKQMVKIRSVMLTLYIYISVAKTYRFATPTLNLRRKPPKMTLWCNNVTTSLRLGDSFHILRRAYAIRGFLPNLKQTGRKTWLKGPKHRQKMTLWRNNVTTLLCHGSFFTHDTMWLCHTHISTKFEANWSRNVATGAKLPPKMTLWRNNVTTLLRHGDFFHMVRCAYAIHMFLPNLK